MVLQDHFGQCRSLISMDRPMGKLFARFSGILMLDIGVRPGQ